MNYKDANTAGLGALTRLWTVDSVPPEAAPPNNLKNEAASALMGSAATSKNEPRNLDSGADSATVTCPPIKPKLTCCSARQALVLGGVA